MTFAFYCAVTFKCPPSGEGKWANRVNLMTQCYRDQQLWFNHRIINLFSRKYWGLLRVTVLGGGSLNWLPWVRVGGVWRKHVGVIPQSFSSVRFFPQIILVLLHYFHKSWYPLSQTLSSSSIFTITALQSHQIHQLQLSQVFGAVQFLSSGRLQITANNSCEICPLASIIF